MRASRPRRSGSALALGLAAAAALSGCHQLGPRRLEVSSAHYSDAVRVATSEQLLANLVRLRYRDLPVFLGVSGISTQFEFDTGIDASGTIDFPGPDSAGIGSGIHYAERPTVSFSIRGGETFQRKMLQPAPVAALAFLADSGWRADRVLRLIVEEMNGLRNAPTASGPTPSLAPDYRDFQEAASLLQGLLAGGRVRLEFEERSQARSDPLPAERIEGSALVDAVRAGAQLRKAASGGWEMVASENVPVLVFSSDADASPEASRLRELLRLAPGQRRFDVVARSASGPDDGGARREIAADMRSLTGTLFYLSQAVEAAPEDVEAGLVTTTRDASGAPFDWSAVLGDIFRVSSSEAKPERAAVAIRHRGHWFQIADDDQSSKSTFLLLDQLFTLTAGEAPSTEPVLTLGVGG